MISLKNKLTTENLFNRTNLTLITLKCSIRNLIEDKETNKEEKIKLIQILKELQNIKIDEIRDKFIKIKI
jgi:hypothetical protein